MKDFLQEGHARPPIAPDQRLIWSRWPSLYSGFPLGDAGGGWLIGHRAANLNAQVRDQRRNQDRNPASQALGFAHGGFANSYATASHDASAVCSKDGGYANLGKRLLDIVLVLLTLPISLPLILMAALALMYEGGNPFYTQDRLGQRGRLFSILKLRTMVCNADQLLESHLARDPALRREWDETQKLKNDPRITPVGRFLRTTSLDELPQLWNVLMGQMSLVGPRPMMPDQLPLYGDATAYFDLKPGITGLWQVSLRNESSFAMRCRADASYQRDLSLRADLGLLWRTVGVVLRGTGY